MAAGEGSSGLTLEDKIDHSSALKEEGNALFKQKDLKKAMKKYHTALMYVRGLVDRPSLLQHTPSAEMADEEQKERIHQIEFSIYNNLAACLLKEERWDRVVENCNKALNLKPDNAKALFRRGQAYFYLKNFDRAEADLKAAAKNEPTDGGIRKMLSMLHVELKKIREKEKRTYAGMFDKLASRETEAEKITNEKSHPENKDS